MNPKAKSRLTYSPDLSSIMVSAYKAKLITVSIHLMVWSLLIYILFNYPPLISKNVKLPSQFLTKQIFHMMLMVITYYLNTYYLVPSLLLKGRKIFFMLCIIVIMISAGLIMARVEIWFDLSEHLRKALGKQMWQNYYIDFFGLFTTMFVLGISTSLAIVQQWNQEWNLRQESETKRAVAELAFLKAQINPHFFFNTLNSIYALTYINAETSREVLLKLSSMMRYLLYETQHNTTSVSKELEFIRNYVEIMKLRLNEKVVIEIVLPHAGNDMCIAPMLLLPFVENAFKHGVDDLYAGSISIEVEHDSNYLKLYVKNTITKGDKGTDMDGKGIGLTNTLRRLELLYKDQHSLEVINDGNLNEYTVRLNIMLS